MEQYPQLAFGSALGIIFYVVLYVTAIVVSTVWDLIKYKDDFAPPDIFQHFQLGL